MSMYVMVLGARSENQSLLKRVGQFLVGKPHVMYMGVFCYMHQCHLITKGLLKVLGGW